MILHCSREHVFTVPGAYRDAHGTWCPKCGESAHSGSQDSCFFCDPRPWAEKIAERDAREAR